MNLKFYVGKKKAKVVVKVEEEIEEQDIMKEEVVLSEILTEIKMVKVK